MCWGVGRDVGRGIRGRCRKVCWGVGKVRGDVGKGEVRKEMWGSVLGPHTLTHFPTPPHILSPYANTLLLPIHSLTPSPLTPYTLPHFSTPHTSFLISPHTPRHFPTPPPHFFPQLPAPLMSPYTPTHFPTHPMHSPHIFPHSFDYVAKLPCDDVTLINLIGKAR